MSKKFRSTRRVAALAAALVLPVLALVPSSSQAADPIVTTTRVFSTAAPAGTPAAPTMVTINARVTSSSGVPQGTVIFIEQSTSVAVASALVDPTGLAKAVVPCNIGGPFCGRYRAEFHGVNGYVDSIDLPGDALPDQILAEPTILKLGGPGLLKLTLTMSARVEFTDGTPKEGIPVYFTLLLPAQGPSGHGTPLLQPIDVCTAWTDVTGLATCGGSAAGAAIVSILTAGAYANVSQIINWRTVKLPVIATA